MERARTMLPYKHKHIEALKNNRSTSDNYEMNEKFLDDSLLETKLRLLILINSSFDSF